MSLKKDITEQTALMKLQQDQIVQLTFERDAARAESKRLRASNKDTSKKITEDGKISASDYISSGASEENHRNLAVIGDSAEQTQAASLIL